MTKTFNFSKIGFIGLGLIGGSLAKLIKNLYPQIQISALATKSQTIQFALKNQIIDFGTTKFQTFPKELDLIFICTPIELINIYLDKLSHHIQSPVLFTDIASVKTNILHSITLQPNQTFISGHPMAGTEKSGIQNSDPKILSNATYILMKSNSKLFQPFQNFLTSLNFKTLISTPQEHDFLLTYASHLPYLMAVTTALSTKKIPDQALTLFQKIISTGFYDTTRVASSPPIWGQNICQYNKTNLLKSISEIENILTELKTLINNNNQNQLLKFFQTAKTKRDTLYN